MAGQPAEQHGGQDEFARRSILAIGITILIVILLLFGLYAIEVLLLLFAAMLLAIVIRAPANLMVRKTGIPERFAIVIVLFLAVAAIAGGGRFLFPRIVEQMNELFQTLPQSIEQVRAAARSHPLGERLMQQTTDIQFSAILTRLGGAFSNLMNAFFAVVFWFVISLYFAFQPSLYLDGMVALFPKKARPRAKEVLDGLAHALRWWLLGRIVAMVALSALVYGMLALLGLPLALALGLLTGLLSFIPIIGALVAYVPAALIAFTQGFRVLVYVTIMYGVAQIVESDIITPLIQQRAVRMPPVLAFAAQLLLGLVAGGLGITLAFPLSVAALVLVKMLYIEDVLHEKIRLAHE